MATAADIRALAEPALGDAGLQLWDVEVERDVVRLLVEREGGVDLEALTDASRAVSGLLDEHDELAPEGRYQLEVSSPGLERTLRTPEQYRRYLGSQVAVKTSVVVAGGRRHRGVLHSVGAEGIELLSDAHPKGPAVVLAFADIDRTLTVVDWAVALKAGSAPAAPTTTANATTADATTADARPADATTANPTTAEGRSDDAAGRSGASHPTDAARHTKDLIR